MGSNPQGHPSYEIPAGSSTPISFGNSTSILIAIVSTASVPQTNDLALFDCPSVAEYNATPTAWKKLYNAVGMSEGRMLDLTLGGDGLQIVKGIVAVPSGAADATGGWLIVLE